MISYRPISSKETFIKSCEILHKILPYSSLLNTYDYSVLWDTLINKRMWGQGERPYVILSINGDTRCFEFLIGDDLKLYYSHNLDVYTGNPSRVVEDDKLPPIEKWINDQNEKLPGVKVSFYAYDSYTFIEAVKVLKKYNFVHGYTTAYQGFIITINSCLDAIHNQLPWEFRSKLPYSHRRGHNLEVIKDLFNSNFSLKLDLIIHPTLNIASVKVLLEKEKHDKKFTLKKGMVEWLFRSELYDCKAEKIEVIETEVIETVTTEARKKTTMSDSIKKAANTVFSTVKDGAEMGPPAAIVTRIVNRVEEFLTKKGVLKSSMTNSKLWKACRNPLCVGIVYFSLLLLPFPEGSKASSLGMKAVQLALKKVSADASEGIMGELFVVVEGIVKDVEHFLPNVDPSSN